MEEKMNNLNFFQKAWNWIKPKAKVFWKTISPEMLKAVKVLLQIGVDVILPIALDAVVVAFTQKGLSGKERFEFAKKQVEIQAPKATAEAVVNAVRMAYMSKTLEGSKY